MQYTNHIQPTISLFTLTKGIKNSKYKLFNFLQWQIDHFCALLFFLRDLSVNNITFLPHGIFATLKNLKKL